MTDSDATLPVRLLKDVKRRAYVRHVCPATSSATVSTAEQVDPAYVVNVSLGGVGLLLRRRLLPGTPVQVEVVSWPQELAKQPARVAHNTPQAAGDWLVGFEFDCPLQEEELRQLLAAAGEAGYVLTR